MGVVRINLNHCVAVPEGEGEVYRHRNHNRKGKRGRYMDLRFVTLQANLYDTGFVIVYYYVRRRVYI